MDTEKKKSTPSGAQSSNHSYSITPDIKLKAQAIFDEIKTGSANAISRPTNKKVDRQLRKIISEANKTGDCIINTGLGYFRPDKDDKEELDHYLWSEMHRAEVIIDKVQSMREAYFGRH